MKHSFLAPAGAALGLLVLAGCASTDNAVFVTKTSISIFDVDTAPASLSVAYDRTEGFFGPAYDTGAAPPVAAIIQTGGNIFTPQVRQLYATGDAARIVTKGTEPSTTPTRLDGRKRMMFFGTSTSTGFKVTFVPDAPLPSSVMFGYKRKEASFIPLGTDGTNGDKYPSVFASIDSTAAMKTRSDAGLRLSQVFATGDAANFMARELREDFKLRAQDTVGAARVLTQQQRVAALDVLQAYAFLSSEQRTKAWEDADRLALFHEGDNEKGQTLARLKTPPNHVNPDAIYADAIGTPNLSDPARLRLLQLHKDNLDKLRK